MLPLCISNQFSLNLRWELSSEILCNYKKSNWYIYWYKYLLYWGSLRSPQTNAVFGRQTSDLFEEPGVFYRKGILKNFAKFRKQLSWKPPHLLRRDQRKVLSCETLILWNICKWLFLDIAKLISTWRNVWWYPIYCTFIWFNYIRIKNKRNAFNSFSNS